MLDTVGGNFGVLLKAARVRKGLTQEKLAEIMGLSLRHICGMENEGDNPSFEVLCKLVHELNIPAREIFYPERQNSNPQLEYLQGLLEQCSERDIFAITALTEAMLETAESMLSYTNT